MEAAQLHALLDQLITTWETEVVEFKQAQHDYDTDRIGEYVSALGNEANLRGQERAWLVFGVHDRQRTVVGTHYRPDTERLNGLKHQIAQGTQPGISFRNIHVLQHPQGRVILFEIPAAPRGIPIAWKGHYYARAGESRVPLGIDKLDEIRQQTLLLDWSAQTVPDTTEADLDPEAVQVARAAFARRHAERINPDDVAQWPLATFLERAGLVRHGQLTRAALLLLGQPHAATLLTPHPAQITWKLEGPERAYEHFGPPFLLSTTRLYQRIRNIQLRLLPPGQLVAVEVTKYEQRIVLEALHNCIAHQDYHAGARILVIEQPDRLIFESVGHFFDGQPEDYVPGDKTPRRYRNPMLANAMSALNMIDTMGYGIHTIYAGQASRYFPLPDYDLSEPGVVKLTIHGSVVDEAYTQLLMKRTDLPLADVLALDRVQKKLPVPAETATRLKRAGLIEGRKPHYRVSATVAAATDSKAAYIRARAQDDAFLGQLVTNYLHQFGQATRKDINDLLIDRLGNGQSDAQKLKKVSNLLSKLRKQGLILNTGSDAAPRWQLTSRREKK